LGIVIGIFPREHPPPHFHAAYSEYQVTVEVENGTVHGGFTIHPDFHTLCWPNAADFAPEYLYEKVRLTVKRKKERNMGRTLVAVLSILAVVMLLAGCGAKTGQAAGEQPAAEEAAAEQGVAASDRDVEPGDAEAPTEVSFAADVAPIFAAKCNACHHPENAVKVDLTRPFHPELGIINRPNTWTKSSRPILVVPGDPDSSALIWKVEQTDLELKVDGDPMPWHIPPLTDRELENLRQWIVQGAKEDDVYRNTITRIMGDGVSLGSRGGRCAYCHYPGAAYGPDLTDLFDPERGSVKVASMFGDPRIVPGDPESSLLFTKVRGEPLPPNLGRPMPLHYERLTAEEQQVLRDWVAEGAKNN